MAERKRVTRRIRLDLALVERGLAASREKARALILAGDVTIGGATEMRAGALVGDEAEVAVAQPARFVSRGGEKLDHAIAHFAIDVGRGQLDMRLRADERVVVMERTHIKDVASLPERPDIAVIDTAFISLTKVLPPAMRIVRPGADIVALVKPQFEAERHEVSRAGVVRDPLVHAAVIGRVAWWCVNHGLRVRGVCQSPLLGPAGNREFFLWLRLDGEEEEAQISQIDTD